MLDKIGADKVIYPERDMGIRVGHNLADSIIVDYIEIVDKFKY
jgi:trk system potassium uptake protein TrkA